MSKLVQNNSKYVQRNPAPEILPQRAISRPLPQRSLSVKFDIVSINSYNVFSDSNSLYFSDVEGTYTSYNLFCNGRLYSYISGDFEINNLVRDTEYPFTITPVDASGNANPSKTIKSRHSTLGLRAPSFTVTDITGVKDEEESYTVNIKYSGGDYTSCTVVTYTNIAMTDFIILGSMSSYKDDGTIKTVKLNDEILRIAFLPLSGNSTIKSSDVLVLSKFNEYYNYPNKFEKKVKLSDYSYYIDYICVGGGGSGGSGAMRRWDSSKRHPIGGGGGGGGAGDGEELAHMPLVGGKGPMAPVLQIKVGAGGAGAKGAYTYESDDIDVDGNDGNPGEDSTFNIGSLTYVGKGGESGKGGHSNGWGGKPGSRNAEEGKNNQLGIHSSHKADGDGGKHILDFGRGSDGTNGGEKTGDNTGIPTGSTRDGRGGYIAYKVFYFA